MVQSTNNKLSKDIDPKEEFEVHWIDLLIVIAQNRKIITVGSVIAGLLGLVISFAMTPMFSSTATIILPQQQGAGLSAILGQQGGIGGGIGMLAGLKSNNDIYVGIVESRTVADKLIQRFNLKERYVQKTMDRTRDELKKLTEISIGKDGVISVTVTDRDPKFSANLANSYVEELENLTQTLAITEASQRRLFLEKYLEKIKDQLANAEVALQKLQEKTGIVQLNAQVGATISASSHLQAAIAAKEVELTSMRTYGTDKNPEIRHLREEIRGLHQQLELINNPPLKKSEDSPLSTEKIPEIGANYIRKLRDVKYYESIFDLLSKQYELARIDESKHSSVIQQLDRAIPAQEKTKPKRVLITSGSFGIGFLIFVLFAFARNSYRHFSEEENGARRIQQLFETWKGVR